MKKFILNMLLNLQIILSPRHWVSIYPTNKVWDRQLQQMLENPKFEYISTTRVGLNGTMLWVSNYPYAYGSKCVKSGYSFASIDLLPTRKTRIRLRRAVEDFLITYEGTK